MNLHGIVRGAINAVNPDYSTFVFVSVGQTTGPDGTRVPAYYVQNGVRAQVQALTFSDLRQLDGLNLNGERRAIYLFGKFDGVVRNLLKGGDMIVILNGVSVGGWLVAQVLEQWPDWCKVAATLQPERYLLDDYGRVLFDDNGLPLYVDKSPSMTIVNSPGPAPSLPPPPSSPSPQVQVGDYLFYEDAQGNLNILDPSGDVIPLVRKT